NALSGRRALAVGDITSTTASNTILLIARHILREAHLRLVRTKIRRTDVPFNSGPDGTLEERICGFLEHLADAYPLSEPNLLPEAEVRLELIGLRGRIAEARSLAKAE